MSFRDWFVPKYIDFHVFSQKGAKSYAMFRRLEEKKRPYSFETWCKKLEGYPIPTWKVVKGMEMTTNGNSTAITIYFPEGTIIQQKDRQNGKDT